MSSRFLVIPILFFYGTLVSHAQSGLSALERELLLGDGSSSNNNSYSESPAQAYKAPEIEEIKVNKSDLEEIEQAIAGPDRIPMEQIFVVQRRYIVKENRHEITPFYFGAQPADSFRRQIQWGFSWAYHFTESFALEGLHVAYMTNYNTGLDDRIEDKTGRKTDFGITPVTIVGTNLLWTPFKSKAATDANVYHFETYFNLGAGVNMSEVSTGAVGMFGIGMRAFMNRRSMLKVELRDYMPFGQASKHRFSMIVGGGILL